MDNKDMCRTYKYNQKYKNTIKTLKYLIKNCLNYKLQLSLRI